jgi:hypothetical protein
VIDFAGLTSTAGGLVVLQPTYNGTDSGSGSVILSNVVLQNGTVALAGGALTLSGTELPSSATFSSINLYVGAYQSQNPSLTFGVASSGSNYNSAFSGSITYYGTNTTLNLANNSGTSIVVSGNINNNTLPGCILDITGSNTVSVTGTITLDVVGTFTDVYLTPTSSNAIGSIFLHGGTLHVNSNNSLGGNPTINVLNTSTLSFEPGTYTESISDTIAYNADSTTLTLSNISGTAITLSGNINNSSYSGSVLTTVPTSGSLTLTGSIAVNTLNATAGTTYLFPDTGSGNSNDYNCQYYWQQPPNQF